MLNCGEVALVVEQDGDATKFVSYTLPRWGNSFEDGEIVTSGSEWVRTSKNGSGVSRDLASAYVLCLRTFVVPNLRRDEGKGLGKKEQTGRTEEINRDERG